MVRELLVELTTVAFYRLKLKFKVSVAQLLGNALINMLERNTCYLLS